MEIISVLKKTAKWVAYLFVLALIGLGVLFFVVTSPEGKTKNNPKIVNDVTQLNPVNVSGKDTIKADALSAVKGWKRDKGQTYLTLPEWYLVYSSDEYAQFISKNKPSEFPYYAASKQFWDYYVDVSTLTKNYTYNQGYHLMLWMIGSSYSLENFVKGIYEKTIGRISEMLAWNARTEEDEFAAKVAADYVSFIRVYPWYDFPFRDKLVGLWTKTDLVGKGILRKWERKIILSNEYAVKSVYAYLIRLGTREVYGDAESEMLVTAKGIDSTVLKNQPKVKLIQTLPDSLQLIALPRYEQFRDQCRTLFSQGVDFKEIAGNDTILLSYVAPSNARLDVPYGRLVIKRNVVTQPSYNRIGLAVPVVHLRETFTRIEQQGIAIEHVYDY